MFPHKKSTKHKKAVMQEVRDSSMINTEKNPKWKNFFLTSQP
jgi:hypothetical protein